MQPNTTDRDTAPEPECMVLSHHQPSGSPEGLRRRLAEILIEIDRVQTAALDALDAGASADEATALNEYVAVTDQVAAELARVLLPPARVAAELRAAQAGLALEAPGLWRALGDVASRFGDGAVGGTGVAIDSAAMAAPTIAIAYSTALVEHPTGTCCEGAGTYLRIGPCGSVATWSEVARGILEAAEPPA